MTCMAAGNMNIKNLGGKIGSYAISTIDMNDWMNEPVVQAPRRTRKNKNTKEIVHRIFIECASVIDDPFWIDKFNAAARGKFPQKFIFHDGILIYRKGAKSHTLEVSNNPYESANTCMDFFRTHGGIFSPMDEQKSIALQHERTHAAQNYEPITWSNINKKMKDCMISHYILEMKRLMDLSAAEMEQLRQTIRLGIAHKFFTKDGIDVRDNRIFTVDGLLWNSDQRIFYVDPSMKPTSTRSYSRKKNGPAAINPKEKDKIPQFGAKWNQYLTDIEKKVARHQRRIHRTTIRRQASNSKVRYLELVTTTELTTPTTSRIDTTTTTED